MQHQLNKLQFEAKCGTEAEAFGMRNYFSQTCQDAIAEVMDKVCTQYVNEDEWIQIEKIEIDLGHLNVTSSKDDFTKILTEKFETILLNKIKGIPASEKQQSKKEAFFKILIHFLQTGNLPWWAGNEIPALENIFENVMEEQPLLLAGFLQEQQFRPSVWQRIAMQFDDKEFRQIILLLPQLSLAEEKITQWAKFFTSKKSIIFNESFESLIRKILMENATDFFKNEDALSLHVMKGIAGKLATMNKILITENEVTEMIVAFEKITTVVLENLEKSDSGKIKSDEFILNHEADETEKYMVSTAGMVLLAPYFKQLFKQLDLMDQGKWKSSEAQYRAIHLARFIATGTLNCPENLHVLEKLLCGLPITAPIPRYLILSDEEKSEAIAVLESVIANWEKLKNTSVEGLRQTFLIREGILTRKENGWLLQVERKTVDVLLDSIPWSFSTLAFTWNSYIIFTEW